MSVSGLDIMNNNIKNLNLFIVTEYDKKYNYIIDNDAEKLQITIELRYDSNTKMVFLYVPNIILKFKKERNKFYICANKNIINNQNDDISGLRNTTLIHFGYKINNDKVMLIVKLLDNLIIEISNYEDKYFSISKIPSFIITTFMV